MRFGRPPGFFRCVPAIRLGKTKAQTDPETDPGPRPPRCALDEPRRIDVNPLRHSWHSSCEGVQQRARRIPKCSRQALLTLCRERLMYRWLVIPLVALAAPPIQAQTVIPDEVVTCPGCDFKIIEGVVIGADPANAIYENSGLWAWRRANGDIWLQSQTAGGLLQVLDSEGRNYREVERQGSGPGEFRDVGALVCAEEGDAAWIFDEAQTRFALIDQAGEITTFPPVLTAGIRGFLPIGDTLMVASGNFRAPGDIGIELLLIDVRTGARVGMTGEPSPEVFNRLTNLHRTRRLSRHSDGRIISAHRHQYVIDLIDPITLEHETLVRDAPWFRPRTTERAKPTDQELWLVVPLEDRFLLTSTVGWADGIDPSRFREGSTDAAEHAAAIRSIIEVIDLETSRVVFRERRNGNVWGQVCPTGEVLAARYSEAGLPTLTVLTVTR